MLWPGAVEDVLPGRETVVAAGGPVPDLMPNMGWFSL